MQTGTQAKLQKIQKISSILRAVCNVLYVLIGIQFVAETVMVLAGRDGGITSFNVAFRIEELSFPERLLLAGMCALTTAVMLKAIFHLRKLFGNYSHGEIFTRESMGQIRQLGITCLLSGGVNILWMFMRRGLGVEPKHMHHGGSDAFPIGIIILVVAWFMDMAVDLREENELTI